MTKSNINDRYIILGNQAQHNSHKTYNKQKQIENNDKISALGIRLRSPIKLLT